MKTQLLIAALILLLPACKKEEPPKAVQTETPKTSPAPTPAPVTGDDVKKEVAEAADTTGKYLDQKKEEWMAAGRQKLAELEAKTTELKALAAEKGAQWNEEAKATWSTAMAELEQQKSAAGAKLEEFKALSGPVLEKANAEFGAAAAKVVSLWQTLKAKVTAPEPAPAPTAPETPKQPDK